MISPIFVTGNIVEYVEREKIDLIVRNKRKIGYQENFIRKYCIWGCDHAHCPVMVVTVNGG